MATIEIQRQGGNYVFEPSQIEIERNDFIIWVNKDPEAAHQPTRVSLIDGTPKGSVRGDAVREPANYWMNDPLPAFVEGQDAATSPAISFAPGSSTPYADGLGTLSEAGPFGIITVKS